jgi:hypothetical protein
VKGSEAFLRNKAKETKQQYGLTPQRSHHHRRQRSRRHVEQAVTKENETGTEGADSLLTDVEVQEEEF